MAGGVFHSRDSDRDGPPWWEGPLVSVGGVAVLGIVIYLGLRLAGVV